MSIEMILKFIFNFGIILVATSSFAQENLRPSFDCDSILEKPERIVCSFYNLSALDKKLNNLLIQKSVQQPDLSPNGKEQKNWKTNVRDKCDNAQCLKNAYEARIDQISSRVEPIKVRGDSTDELKKTNQTEHSTEIASSPSLAVGSNSDIQEGVMDAEAFIGNPQIFLQRVFWINPRNDLFGKSVLDWSDNDFMLLDRKLRKQIESDFSATLDYYRKRNLKIDPQSDSVFLFRKKKLEDAISQIPQIRDWIILARQQMVQAEEARIQADLQREERLAIARQEAEERNRALEAEKNRELEIRQENERIAAEERDIQRIKAMREKNSADTTVMVLILGLLAVSVFVWNKFFRNRCSECDSTEIKVNSVEELDRWKGKTKVYEKNSRGTNTRYISVTKVKNKYSFICEKCGHEWDEEIIQDL